MHPACTVVSCMICINIPTMQVSAKIAAITMSQAIGAAVASVRVANLLGSLAIMMFLLFGGFLLNRDQVPWYCTWIADLSYFNYAYEALAVSTAYSLHSSARPFNPSVADVLKHVHNVEPCLYCSQMFSH